MQIDNCQNSSRLLASAIRHLANQPMLVKAIPIAEYPACVPQVVQIGDRAIG
jgi:hypothetical protein